MAAQTITNATDTLPRSKTLTGTITAAADSRTINGTSTLFLEQLRIGDSLYDTVNGEIREVESIQSNTELRVKVGFTNAQSAATLKRVVNNARQITLVASGGDVTITKHNDDTLLVEDGDSWTPKAKRNGIVEAILVTAGSGVNARYDVVDR